MNFLSNDKWTSEEIPDLEGKKVIVTGANSGLGFEASKMFAANNAHVVMACRSLEKGRKAREEIEEDVEEASLEVRKIDLASLQSVKDFAEAYRANNSELHILCNNAGVMAIPRDETEDGFEMQFGVNHLGHFALTGHLIDILRDTDGETRVVTQSSGLHENGTMNFDDLMMEDEYNKWDAYAQSKLANVLFGYELDRKLEDEDVESVVCHPGYAATDLQYRGPIAEGSKTRYFLMKAMNTVVAQSARKGALPLMYAATSEDAEGGMYIGPGGLANMRGYPVEQKSSEESYSKDAAKALWTRSEALTDIEFEIGE
ncbi:oxidoreductase [Candidatus Nanosalina sp. VS9-1]|uniref:oxidoreductase n=1 Tax=Candidatus Nanosalina sp. VS9-1 TaxID=3388566 RepID=UPI0039E12985